jgi:hypothetical protein
MDLCVENLKKGLTVSKSLKMLKKLIGMNSFDNTNTRVRFSERNFTSIPATSHR